jgi:hypothetical protein
MEKFEFKLEGPIFQEGVPIHLVIKAWDNFQSIIDKTYLVASESHRITSKDREKYYLRAKEFRRSSFLTKFEIFLAGVQLTLPLVGILGPQNIWEYTKETFSFLKLICSDSSESDGPKIEIKDSQNVSVQFGDQHKHFYGPIVQIAEKALPKYQDLAHMLEEGKLESISAGSLEKPEIALKTDERNLFDLPTTIEKDPIEVKCEIFDFNKFKNIGKMRVAPGQSVPSGDYSFSIFGSQDNVDYIYSMLKPLVTVNCIIEKAKSPLGPKLISHLHVTGFSS